MKKLFFILLAIQLTACAKVVKQGELGIVTNFAGSVDDEVVNQGFHITLLRSIQAVDATEVRVPMKGLNPKDKDGVLFDLDLTVTYKVNPSKAVAFYKQTHEIDVVVENEDRETVLGYRVLEDVINNSTTKTFNEFAVSEIVPKKADIEARLKEIIQQKIDARYADAFQIVNVNINRTKLGDAVEQVLQSQAIAKSQRQLLDLQQQLVEKQTELINKKMEGLRKVATTNGLGMEKLMDFKLREQYNEVLSEIAKNHGETQIQVNSKGQ